MKNVHLLLAGESYLSLNCSYRDSAIGTQVGKPYWTYTKDWKHHMSVTDASVRPHNIYITNDEEIKDGDYYLYLKDNSVQQFIKKHHTKLLALDIQKKIVLTTDQDLIKDGVQAIDDEFLEWFVKNPSCEEVQVGTEIWNDGRWNYFLPKKEPKLQCKDCNDNLTDCTCIEDTIDMKQTPGKETADYIDRHIVEAMVEVAKQNLYSEEEVLDLLNDCRGENPIDISKWFEQFRKK